MAINTFLDNGLTLEQQEHADNVYETLMSDLKTINPKLYQRLRTKELTEKDVYKLINSKNKNIIINDKEQLEFFGD
tara:strand:- start:336 stop:563 length:228 start_codon:yes stop_codon:yes gene_type:complete